MPNQYLPITTDPRYDAYCALWTMLEANADFLGWFSNPGQRVKLNEQWIWAPNPDPQDLTPAEFPRIRIAWKKASFLYESDSCGSQEKWMFETQIWTGSQQQTLLMACLWPIGRAMLNWRQYLRDALTWNGKPYVFDVNPEEVEIENPDLENEPLKARGYDQWIPVHRATVSMVFQTTAMKAL